MSLLEKNVIITTKHGQCPGFAACPDAPGSYPAIILYMDAPGFREELCNMARRIAKQGYYCLLPDLYYRLGTCRFDIPRRTDAMSAVIKAAMNSLTIAEVNDDTGAFVAWLDAQSEVKAGPMGCVGHCMSGRYITAVAARFPTRMVACASLYGVGIVTDKEDSPHLTLSQVKGELYFGFAKTDGSVPEHVIPELTKALEKAGTQHTVEVLEGTLHGFCFSERASYHPLASEHAWAKLFDLWGRHLQ